MKIKSLLVWAFTALFAVAMTSCGDDVDGNGGSGIGTGPGTPPDPFPGTEETFVLTFNEQTVEENVPVAFQSKTPESYGFYVESSESWKVSRGDASWIEIEKNDAGFVLTALRNREASSRTAVISVTSGGVTKTVTATQAKPRVIVFNFDSGSTGLMGIPGGGVSANGRYVIGGSSNVGWIFDLEAQDIPDNGEEVVVVGADMNHLRWFTPFAGYLYCHVSDDGGVYHHWGMTPDGSIKVFDESEVLWTSQTVRIPYAEINGVVHELPNPREAQIGTLTPHGGYYAMMISDDGKYISGVHQTYRGAQLECGWKYNETTGRYDYIFYDDEEIEISEWDDTWAIPSDSHEWTLGPKVMAMSRNGKYTAGIMTQAASNSGNIYLRNIETGKIEVYNREGQPTVITDEGLLCYGDRAMVGRFLNMENGETKSTMEWIADTFGIENPDAYIGNYLIRDMSTDYTTLVMTYIISQTMRGTQVVTVQ